MKKKADIIYNMFICVLAVTSVTFAIIDINSKLSHYQLLADNIIYCIFIIDYIVRLLISHSKPDFVKSNLLDLLAIIPFNSIFRIFRLFKIFRFSRILKLTKFLRIGSRIGKLFAKVKTFFNTNGLKYVIYLILIAICLSSIAMMYFEKMCFKDSLWWSFVTATTVGYGDLSPSTNAGRIIASILMLCGIGLVGSLTSSITTFFLNDNKNKSEDDVNIEKIEMVITLYDKLSDKEKNIFKNKID